MSSPVLDFSRVQYPTDAPPPKSCAFCGRGIEAEHYTIADNMSCSTCVDNVRAEHPTDTHKAFMRSLLWGIPAAILGMALYAGFEIVTGISIGYLAIGVGYLVAKAMLRGSGGVRGRRYQWTAVLLTYAAVAMAFLPVVIAAQIKESKAKTAAVQTTDAAKPATAPEKAAEKADDHGVLYAIGMLLGLGIISPFYELTGSFASGLIGLLILFWGMRAAWQLMAAPNLAIEGPITTIDAA